MSDKQHNGRSISEPVQQDGPVMRSVMLAPPSSAPSLSSLRRSASPIQQKAAPTRLVGIPKPKSWSAKVSVAEDKQWNVTEIPELPHLYPLETCQSVSLTNTSPQLISSRICASLKNQSIHILSHESSSLEAETSNHVRFRLQLFTSNHNTTLVTLQRRCGCCIFYHQVARALLEALTTSSAPTKKRMPPPPRSFCVSDSIKQAHAAKHPTGEQEEEALEMALDMVQNERLDAQLLGMQSLVCLSKCSRSNLTSNTKVMTILSSLVCFKRLPNTTTDDSDSEELFDFELDHANQMNRCALTVLSNALSSTKKTVSLDAGLVSTLVQTLGDAPRAPHEACCAATCLRFTNTLQFCDDKDFHNTYHSAMEVALEVGNQEHANLMRCTQELMDATNQ